MRIWTMAMLAGGLALQGCGKAPDKAPDAAPTLHELMKNVMAPQAQNIWAVGNKSFDEVGDPDGALLDDSDWAKVAAASEKLGAAARDLAGRPDLAVARPGVKLDDEDDPGAANAAMVSGYIAADRAGFANFAKALAETADTFGAAARTQDIKALAGAADGLDSVCEACHLKYWYPHEAVPE